MDLKWEAILGGWSSLASYSEKSIKKSIEDTNDTLSKITGYSNFIFRAPNLDVSQTMCDYIKALLIQCSIDSRDWDDSTTDEIIANITKAQDGDIVYVRLIGNNSGTTGLRSWLTDSYLSVCTDATDGIYHFSDSWNNLTQGDFALTYKLTATDECNHLFFKGPTYGTNMTDISFDKIQVSIQKA